MTSTFDSIPGCMFHANLVILAQICDKLSHGQAGIPRILSKNGQNDLECQGQWPPFSIPAESIPGCMCGANLMIPAQICDELSCGQGKVYGQTGRQTDRHDDFIKWKIFPRYWPFLRGIHRSPVKSHHKGQWRGALMFSLICDLNKPLSKQPWGWWFETPTRSLWRHCMDTKPARDAIHDDAMAWERFPYYWLFVPFAVNSFDPFFGFATLKYHRTSNISGTLEGNKIVDHSDVVGASPVSAVPTTSLSWLQWIGQRQLQEETIKTEVLGFDASWFSGLTVYIGHPFPYYRPHLCDKSTCPATQRVCIVEISFFLCFFVDFSACKTVTKSSQTINQTNTDLLSNLGNKTSAEFSPKHKWGHKTSVRVPPMN